MLLGRQPFLKKTYFYSVFWKTMSKKNLAFWTALPQKKKFARCWITSESSLIGPKTQNTKTLIGTKICHKNPQKNPIFVVRKWAPQEVVLFLTLEVVPKLTLERPKSGTKTNSPAKEDRERRKRKKTKNVDQKDGGGGKRGEIQCMRRRMRRRSKTRRNTM